MKRTFFICICVLLVAGCRTPQKITSQTTEIVKTNETKNEVSNTGFYSIVDTTKKSGLEIQYFKIEFYPPTTTKNSQDTMPDNSNFPVELSNSIGNNKPPIKGAIKSIEAYTVKSASEQTGINEEKSNTTINKSEENNTDITKDEKITKQPAPDPYRWRYIFGILIVFVFIGIGLYLLLKKYHILK